MMRRWEGGSPGPERAGLQCFSLTKGSDRRWARVKLFDHAESEIEIPSCFGYHVVGDAERGQGLDNPLKRHPRWLDFDGIYEGIRYGSHALIPRCPKLMRLGCP